VYLPPSFNPATDKAVQIVIGDAGHSAMEAGIEAALISATDALVSA
jgi:hypothetical protein